MKLYKKIFLKKFECLLLCAPITCTKKSKASITADVWDDERNKVTGSYMQMTVGNLGLKGSEMSVIPLL